MFSRWVRLSVVCLVVVAGWPAAAGAQGSPGGGSTTNESGARLAAAAAIQGATRARLGVLGDAFACADARFVSFRNSDANPQVVFQWYVASQLWADAELLRVATAPAAPAATPPGDNAVPPADNAALPPGNAVLSADSEARIPAWDAQDTRCYLEKGFVFLDRLWDYSSAGYFPGADPVGGNVDRTARFTDDNLIAGLALLDAARTTSDAYAVRRYIHAAQREADFLLLGGTGLWDTTFGGGFWWNTGHGDSPEGKPAQTNALAALFFARLYAVTNDPNYREWALRSLLWLDTILYDPGRHLYRWSVSFQDVPQRTGAVVSQRYFNYDQGIAVEAQLAARLLDGDQNRLTRARDIARSMQATFWSSDLGGYNLEAGVEQVYTSYAAWTSLGYLALYDVDRDSSWLDLTRSNLQALEAKLGEADHGFANRVYRCVDRIAAGCETGQAMQVVDHTRDTAAQAWGQHLQSAFAERLQGQP